jgi:hypothetical protein
LCTSISRPARRPDRRPSRSSRRFHLTEPRDSCWGPRLHLRPGVQRSGRTHGYRAGAHRPAGSLAESVRGPLGGFHPPRVPGPRHRAERGPSAPNPQGVFHYYHNARAHLALDRNSPNARSVEAPAGEVVSKAYLGGLHHLYKRAA